MKMFNKILSTVSVAVVSAMVLVGGSTAPKAATFIPTGADTPLADGGTYNLIPNDNPYGVTVNLTSGEVFSHSYNFNIMGGMMGFLPVKWQIDNSADTPGNFGIANLIASWDGTESTPSAEGDTWFTITDNTGQSLFPTNMGVNDWYMNMVTNGLHTLTFAGTALINGGTYVTNVSAVPLPPAALLFGTALFGIGALRRRKDKKAMDLAA